MEQPPRRTEFVVSEWFKRPSGEPILNFEGMTLRDLAEERDGHGNLIAVRAVMMPDGYPLRFRFLPPA